MHKYINMRVSFLQLGNFLLVKGASIKYVCPGEGLANAYGRGVNAKPYVSFGEWTVNFSFMKLNTTVNGMSKIDNTQTVDGVLYGNGVTSVTSDKLLDVVRVVTTTR